MLAIQTPTHVQCISTSSIQHNNEMTLPYSTQWLCKATWIYFNSCFPPLSTHWDQYSNIKTPNLGSNLPVFTFCLNKLWWMPTPSKMSIPLQKCSAKQLLHLAFYKIPPRHTWNIYRNPFYSCVKAHTPLQKTAWDTGNTHGQEGKGSASVTETCGTRGLLLVTISFLSCAPEFCGYFSYLTRNQTDLHIPTSVTTVHCVFMTLIRISQTTYK